MMSRLHHRDMENVPGVTTANKEQGIHSNVQWERTMTKSYKLKRKTANRAKRAITVKQLDLRFQQDLENVKQDSIVRQVSTEEGQKRKSVQRDTSVSKVLTRRFHVIAEHTRIMITVLCAMPAL